MQDAQTSIGLLYEDLRRAPVFDIFLHRLAERSHDPSGVEFKVVTCDRGRLSDRLHLDRSQLHADSALRLEIFAFAPRRRQASWFRAIGDRTEDRRLGQVKLLDLIRQLAGERSPESRDFRAHLIYADAHARQFITFGAANGSIFAVDSGWGNEAAPESL